MHKGSMMGHLMYQRGVSMLCIMSSVCPSVPFPFWSLVDVSSLSLVRKPLLLGLYYNLFGSNWFTGK